MEHRTALHDDVVTPRAYLVRMTTRLCRGRIRTIARRREHDVGPWLPEPLLTSPDVADDVALADSVSTAMLLVLEILGPTERAVFVLREVFDLSYDEIAAAVDRSPATVRQVAHRAGRHVAARRPRVEVPVAEHTAVVERFRRAAQTGDLQQLVDLLAPGVVLVTDGGGRVKAALRPITGRDKMLRFLTSVMTPDPSEILVSPAWVNGRAGMTFTSPARSTRWAPWPSSTAGSPPCTSCATRTSCPGSVRPRYG